MRWKVKTQSEIDAGRSWHLWFAWYPVAATDKERGTVGVWWEWVERKVWRATYEDVDTGEGYFRRERTQRVSYRTLPEKEVRE